MTDFEEIVEAATRLMLDANDGWLWEEAQRLYLHTAPLLPDLGYILSMYGSVVERGYGRDLDLMATPHGMNRGRASAQKVAATLILATLGNPGRCVSSLSTDGHTFGFVWERLDGRIIDLTVRETP